MALRGVRVAVAFLAIATAAGEARAYEFDIRARTIAQLYDRTWFTIDQNPVVARRRFTEMLSLDIWDLAGRRKGLRARDAVRPRGPNIYFTSHLRVDHDFGSWTTGNITFASASGFFCGQSCDAIDLIPELENGAMAVDVLYGYFAVDDLFGGILDVHVGRHLQMDTLDWWSYDGASVRAETPWYVAVEANAGLAVRESSPLASPTFELDGTSGGQCLEYVEADMAGEGAWQLPFRDFAIERDPFRADLDEDWCKQRDKLMPTWGGAIETTGLGILHARASYRRTMSRTVGVVHGSQDPPDLGWYPNEFGDTAPDWGVNQEAVGASVRANFGHAWQITPYAEGRYSLLHGRIDQAAAGTRVAWKAHSLEPMVYYSFPTFDGDSIFNVFSGKAYYDARLHYELAPRAARWRAFARGWVREFHNEDTADVESGSIVRDVAYASGGQLGGSYRFARDRQVRLDLFHELGYGGTRTGGMGAARWRVHPTLELNSRVSGFQFDEDQRPELNAFTLGAQAGLSWQLNVEGVAVHLWFEDNTNDLPHSHSQWRVIGVLDLAFQPET
jgi:hypothetical protein